MKYKFRKIESEKQLKVGMKLIHHTNVGLNKISDSIVYELISVEHNIVNGTGYNTSVLLNNYSSEKFFIMPECWNIVNDKGKLDNLINYKFLNDAPSL